MERFETIDAGDRRSFKARGKEFTLFDGFQFDLDAGQVVPEGLGGDIVFLTQGPGRPAFGCPERGLESVRWKSRRPLRPRSPASRRLGEPSCRAISLADTT